MSTSTSALMRTQTSPARTPATNVIRARTDRLMLDTSPGNEVIASSEHGTKPGQAALTHWKSQPPGKRRSSGAQMVIHRMGKTLSWSGRLGRHEDEFPAEHSEISR